MVDLDTVRIEPLVKQHCRGAFCCGVAGIDNFVKNNARKDNDAYKIRAFVACANGSKDVVGIYTLTLTAVEPISVDDTAAEKFERVQAVPAVYLALVAVQKEWRKSGLSDLLMQDAFERALIISEHAGAYALTLDAISEKVASRYEELGFERFAEGELKMFIPLQVLRDAKASPTGQCEVAAA